MRRLLLLFLCTAACATVIVSSTGGSNSDSCGSEADPCATLAQGVLMACRRGDTSVLVSPGSYDAPAGAINCSLVIMSTGGPNSTSLNCSTPMNVNDVASFALVGFTISPPYPFTGIFLDIDTVEDVTLSNLAFPTAIGHVSIGSSSKVAIHNITWTDCPDHVYGTLFALQDISVLNIIGSRVENCAGQIATLRGSSNMTLSDCSIIASGDLIDLTGGTTFAQLNNLYMEGGRDGRFGNVDSVWFDSYWEFKNTTLVDSSLTLRMASHVVIDGVVGTGSYLGTFHRNLTFQKASFHNSSVGLSGVSNVVNNCTFQSTQVSDTSTNGVFNDTTFTDRAYFDLVTRGTRDIFNCSFLDTLIRVSANDRLQILNSRFTNVTPFPSLKAMPLYIESSTIIGGYFISSGDLEIYDSTFQEMAGPENMMLSCAGDLIISRSSFQACSGSIQTTKRRTSVDMHDVIVEGGTVVTNTSFLTSQLPHDLRNVTFRNMQLNANAALIDLRSASASLRMGSCSFVNITALNASLIYVDRLNSFSQSDIRYSNNILENSALVGLWGIKNNLFENLTVENNTYSAGYYFGEGSTTQLLNSRFTRNQGMSILAEVDAVITIRDVQFINGSAEVGSCIVAADSAIVTCEDNEFFGNQAINGGAIFTANSSKISLTNCTAQGNAADAQGGVLALMSSELPSIANCSFENNSAREGAAIYCKGAGMTLTNARFVNNLANFGTVFLSEPGRSGITECAFINNTALDSGGAVTVSSNAQVSLSSCVMRGNTAPSGGAVCLEPQSTFAASNSIFQENEATSGGCIYANTPKLNVTDCLFLNNQALEAGGAVTLSIDVGAVTSFTNSTFQHNEGAEGGAIRMIMKGAFDPPVTTFSDCLFADNTALIGGAIYCDDAATIRCTEALTTFSNNVAEMYGGAISLGSVSKTRPIFLNVAFDNNYAQMAAGSVMIETVDSAMTSENVMKLPQSLCSSCVYDNNTTPGYQTPDGWASTPFQLVMISSLCDSHHSLGDIDFSFTVQLRDALQVEVKGELLSFSPFVVEASYSGTHVSPISGLAVNTMNTSGTMDFESFELCSSSDGTVHLGVRNINDTSEWRHMSVAPISDCTFYIGSCADGWEAVEDPENEQCEICHLISPYNMKTIALWTISICLCCALLVIVGTLTAYKAHGRMKRRLYERMEIPDIIVQPDKLSLKALVEDSTVPMLEWEHLKVGAMLGEGAFGIVSRGEYRGEPVAIKELIVGVNDQDSENVKDFLKEIVTMNSLEDDNIVRFVGIALPPDQSRLCLVTELMERGSISDIMKKKGENVSQSMRYHFAIAAAKGISHMHEKSLIHRDLKADNLLVDREWNCKIADFGISTLVLEDTGRKRTCIGTPTYIAPEVLNRKNYTQQADVYSFGIVLYELFSGKRAYSEPEFAELNPAALNGRIVEGARPDYGILPEKLAWLVERCLDENPDHRPTSSEVCEELKAMHKGSSSRVTKVEEPEIELQPLLE